MLKNNNGVTTKNYLTGLRVDITGKGSCKWAASMKLLHWSKCNRTIKLNE